MVLYDQPDTTEKIEVINSTISQPSQDIKHRLRLTKSHDFVEPSEQCNSTCQKDPHLATANKHKLRSTKSNTLDDPNPSNNNNDCYAKPNKRANGYHGNGEKVQAISKTQQPDVSAPITFDPYDEVYMANACCECMHYRYAAAVVGVLEIVFMLIWAGLASAYYITNENLHNNLRASAGCQIAAGAVMLISILLLIAGVIFEKSVLLFPHLIIQVLGVASGLILTILAVIVMAVGNTSTVYVFGFIFGAEQLPILENRFGPIWPFCLAVLFDFMAAIGVWFYVVVKGYYDFLQDKQFYEKLAISKNQITSSITMNELTANSNGVIGNNDT